MSKMKRLLLAIVLISLSLCCIVAVCEENNYRTLQLGDEGTDVLELKERMYYLGYFNSLKLTEKYNQTMVERVCQLQKNNGLAQTGIATPELQELIYSDACVWQAPTPRPTTPPTPAPTPHTPQDEPELPETDENGFLIAEEPYVYANSTEGHWIYLSQDIQVEIKKCVDTVTPLIWFETRICLAENVKLSSLLVPGKAKTTFKQPADIIKNYTDDTHQVVLAFSDDFFGYRRRYEGNHEGIIIRDGVIQAESTVKAETTKWPPLEILAVFADGTLKTYESNEKTAAEYLQMGVMDTYAFGPILIQNGKIRKELYSYDTTDRDPRTAIGMIAPREYLVLTVTGRRSDSKGVSLLWLAQKMQENGVTEALNLDGGNTCSLLFMGELINRAEGVKSSDIRYVSGLIGVIEEKK